MSFDSNTPDLGNQALDCRDVILKQFLSLLGYLVKEQKEQ